MPNHTPGPWRKSKSAGGAVVSSFPPKNFNDKLKPAAQQALLDYHSGYVVADMVSWENIDLIIAAPDLLAAAETAHMTLIRQGGDARAIARLEAAIAKAKGGDACS